MQSFWQTQADQTVFDLAVVGGGFSGLNAALFLKKKQPSIQIVVLDAHGGKNSASLRNAGFACFGSPSELLHDMELMGKEAALELLAKRWQGVRHIRQTYGRNCQFEPVLGHELFTKDQTALFTKCAEHLNELNRDIHQVTGKHEVYHVDLSETQFGTQTRCISIKGEGQLNPASLHAHLLKECCDLGVHFRTGFRVLSIEPSDGKNEVRAEEGTVLARKVVVCTNGFTEGLVPVDVLPARAQVLITSELGRVPFEGNFHMQEGYFYFRNVGKRVLLGGGRNLDITGETTSRLALNPIIQECLDQLLKTVILPGFDYSVERRWAGIMGVRSDKLPKWESHENGLYSIVGLSGMGVALAPVLAKEWVNAVW